MSGLPGVDRRLFIPEVIYVRDAGHWLVPLRRKDDPEEWERLVADPDEAVCVRTDEHDPKPAGFKNYPPGKGAFPTSSSSAPSVMARMIEILDVEPGMRVLEIGTGTGYNAACLAALGAEVVTVEIDPELAERARDALLKASFPGVVVVTGDGEHGAPEWAPFDRVICTAAVHTIPFAWVEQTKNGGLIVAPYTGEGCQRGCLVLTVQDGIARGTVGAPGLMFMPLRGQRLSPSEINLIENKTGLRVEVTAEGQRLLTDQP